MPNLNVTPPSVPQPLGSGNKNSLRQSQGERLPSATKIGATVAPSSSVDTDMLLLAVEPGLRVQARHQFFNWTQGAL